MRFVYFIGTLTIVFPKKIKINFLFCIEKWFHQKCVKIKREAFLDEKSKKDRNVMSIVEIE